MFSMRKVVAAFLCLVLLLPLLPLPAEGAEPVFGTLWQHFSALEEKWVSRGLVWEEVPQYYQTDYPDTPYGHGTVSTSGCGIVCLSMAATYLKDRNLSPEILAAQFGQLEMNNVQRIDYAIEELDLPFAYKPRRWSQMMAALREGRLVILLVNGSSVFTDGQHMLLLTGITESGRVTVYDPYEPNYNRVELITGYTHGFREETLAEGFDGGWIFGQKEENVLLDIVTPYRNLRSQDWTIH